MDRRAFLMRAGVAALGSTVPSCSLGARAFAPDADHKLTISNTTFEIAHNKFLKTIAYNQQVPGPMLRLQRGRRITVEVTNATSRPEIVHWHGLRLPSAIDGAMEEGTPMIAPGQTTRIEFTPDIAGLRWYHTHTFAGSNLHLGQYSGQHGMLLVEDAGSSATSFDKELPIVLHDWDGQLSGGDDGTMQPSYNCSTINGRVEAFNEPLQVKRGDRVLFQILNASATDIHWLRLEGHNFQVIALDGNPLPSPRTVAMLRLAPAERVSALVTMNNPGRWVMADPRKHVRAAGMGIVLEYAGATGAAQWNEPNDLTWDYMNFVSAATQDSNHAEVSSPQAIPIVIESKFRGHGAPEQWLLNGQSYPQGNAPVLQSGQRYRLQFVNRSMDDHPLHLHRHTFQLASIAGKPLKGPVKDTVLVQARTTVEVDFTADNPGPTLLHCHQQDHMDRGFMMVLRYA